MSITDPAGEAHASTPEHVEPDHTPAHSFVCGGCGASSDTGFPPCVSGQAPHQAPAAEYPHRDWLLHNIAHPTGAHDDYLAGFGHEQLDAMLKAAAGPTASVPERLKGKIAAREIATRPPDAAAPDPAPRDKDVEVCPQCKAVINPPRDIGYCRNCNAPLPRQPRIRRGV
jgi:hypothetical protein